MADPAEQAPPVPEESEHHRSRAARLSYLLNTFRHVFFNINSFLFALSIVAALILTNFSRTGQLVFDGTNIWWKIALFQVQLELSRTVFFSDAIGLLVEYVVTRRGISADLLSHAMGAVTPLFSGSRNWFYKVGFTSAAMFSSLLTTVLVSFVIVPNPSSLNREPVKGSKFVETNSLGGRMGNNYGATGEMLLFNASSEKFKLPDTHQTFGLYIKAATRRQIFIPKVPQIGPYSAECNSDHDVNIVEARVLDVQGLLYDCEPQVKEIAQSIEKFPTPFEGTSRAAFRLLNDSHTRIGNSDTRAEMYFRAVIARPTQEVSMFELRCEVQAAEATIDAKMNDRGVMGLSMPKGAVFEKKNLTLPPRVLGDLDNNLHFALANSIGARGIGEVEDYVATSFTAEWEGLLYWIVTSYGVRSASKDTFVDANDRRDAVNVKQLSTRRTLVEVLRVPILWVPVAIVLLVRIISMLNTNMFNGNVKQVFDWMNWNDGDNPTPLIERIIAKTTEPGPNLYVRVVSDETGRNELRFSPSAQDRGDRDRRLRGAEIKDYRSGRLRLRNTHFGYREQAKKVPIP